MPVRIGSKFVCLGCAILVFLTLTGNGQSTKGDLLLASLSKATADSIKIPILIELSRWNTHADFTRSVEYADQALQTATALNDSKLLADAMTQRARVYWSNGQYDSSVSLNTRSITLRNLRGDDSGIAENYFAVAMNHYYSADYELAISFHLQALDKFKALKDHRKAAEVLNMIGLVYYHMGNYPKTIYYLHEFSRERKHLTGFRGRTYNLGNTSPYFRSAEFFGDELKIQLAALDELKNSKEEEDLYLTYLNIADTYKELRDYENALQYHKQAAAFAKQIGFRPEYTYLGNAYRALGKTDSAIQLHQYVINVARTKVSGLDMLYNYISLGKDYEVIGDYKKALEYCLLALEMTTGMNNKLDIVILGRRAAYTLVQLGSVPEARTYALRALTYAQRIQARTHLRDCYELLADIESKLHNYDAAFSYMKASKALADSLTTGEAELQYAQTQAQFEVDTKDRDIEILRQEKELREATIRNKDLLILGITLGSALLILLALSSFLRYRQKNKANKILLEQKHQIEVLLGEIHHRVKNNLQVISSLLSIQSEQLKNEDARMAVLEGHSRVQAMGLIHENIYQTENFASIELKNYMQKLSDALSISFGLKEVRVYINTNNLSVDVDTAIPLGLIVNELLTNCLKHAFNNVKEPAVLIELGIDESKLLFLKVTDNGQGLHPESNTKSFGLRLVKELAAQLGGSMEFLKVKGFSVHLRFRKFKIAA